MAKITEMMEEHKKKLMASHEVLAEMKIRKTEMSVRKVVKKHPFFSCI